MCEPVGVVQGLVVCRWWRWSGVGCSWWSSWTTGTWTLCPGGPATVSTRPSSTRPEPSSPPYPSHSQGTRLVDTIIKERGDRRISKGVLFHLYPRLFIITINCTDYILSPSNPLIGWTITSVAGCVLVDSCVLQFVVGFQSV